MRGQQRRTGFEEAADDVPHVHKAKDGGALAVGLRGGVAELDRRREHAPGGEHLRGGYAEGVA